MLSHQDNSLIAKVRLAPWWLFALVMVVLLLFTCLAVWIVPRRIWLILYEPSFGLVNFAYLAYTLVVIGGVLLAIGRLRPAEVGIELCKLPQATVMTLMVWLALQLVMFGYYWIAQKPIRIANSWEGLGWLTNVGVFVGHFFGNAFNEEVVYRGFFLLQFALLARLLMPHWKRLRFVFALVAASVVFSFMHLPDRLAQGLYPTMSSALEDQLALSASGCAYGWVFLRTQNLFVAIGLHTLVNLPTTLLVWHDLDHLTAPMPVVMAIGLLVGICWPRRKDD